MLEETRTAEAEAEVAPVEAAAREPWQMTREEFAGAFGSPDNWASVVRRNLEQGKDVPIAVRSELEAYDAQRASRSALPPEQDKAKVGDTVVRYTHADGTGLLNNSGLDRSKLTDSEENELVELMDLGLRQPPEGTSGTFYFTQAGEKQHARMLELLGKASKSGIVRTESTLTNEPTWESNDGQVAAPARATGTEVIPVEGRGFKTRNRKASFRTRFRYQSV
jgi:hypothetical protein